MRMDRLTNQLQLALSDAQSLALGKDHNAIDPLHLLSALLEQKNGSVRPLLSQAGANLAGLREAINQKNSVCTNTKTTYSHKLFSGLNNALVNVSTRANTHKVNVSNTLNELIFR